jgi:DNA-binding CsgD family transcriptional regulator
MRANVGDILSDLDTLTSERAFKRKFESAFSQLGFDAYTYVSVDIEELESGKLRDYAANVICLTNLPPAWVAHYADEVYADADPVIRDCTSNRLPIRWTESYRANARSAAETRMMEDAWENGVRRGLSIPIHGPRGELGVFSLNSQLNDKEFLRVSDETKFDAQVIAYHFHDAVQRTLKSAMEIPLPVPLTDREVEILRWTVSGKTAWEIGGILKISERTVNFHIQNVMEKFGVHNKTHAAAKAMGMGLLNL